MRFCIVQSASHEVSFTRGAGHFRTSDIRQVNEISAKSELFRRGAPVVNDMRFVNFDVASSEIMAMRALPPHVPSTEAERRVAFIAGSELGYGMLRMLATVRETPGRISRVFRSFGEAFDWIDRPELGNRLPPEIDALLSEHVPGADDADDGFRIFVRRA